MTTAGPSIVVSGASCQIGHFLLPQLAAAGFHVHALSRQPPSADNDAVTWHRADLAGQDALDIKADGLIHLAPLPLLPALLPRLDTSGLTRVIAFGSTSRYTKALSADPSERAFAGDLEKAELALAEFCRDKPIAWTIFRPTLIYGCGKDKNVTVIARFLRRFRVFPLLGGDGGLRQPVHAEDLARACVQAWNNPAAFNRGYNLSGAEVLTYRAMVERIFRAEGLPPRFIPVPLPLLRLGIRALQQLPRYRYLSMEMVDRMAANLSFDHAAARQDFGFTPRAFEPPQTAP